MTMPRGDNVRRKFGDRRGRPRFDIVGDLWGTFETVLTLPLKNVSRGGALVESHVPLAAESVHRMTFRSQGEDLATDVRVRYVRPLAAAGAGGGRFLIGLEFIAAHPLLVEEIGRWMLESDGGAARMEA